MPQDNDSCKTSDSVGANCQRAGGDARKNADESRSAGGADCGNFGGANGASGVVPCAGVESVAGVVGVGIDLVDVARIEKMLKNYREAFLARTFTRDEIDYCEKFSAPAQHYAARFAAKEAMAKALGTGFSGAITLKSVAVKNADSTSAPVATLDCAAQKAMEKLGGKKMLVSLTHLKDYAQAIAVITK